MSVSAKVFLKLAATRPTLMAGAKIALIVGVILNLINQGDLFLGMQWGEVNWLKSALTFCVPFCVSVYSSTASRIRFDPGTRAWTKTSLKCTTCNGYQEAFEENQVVTACPSCGEHTKWELLSGS